MKIIFICYEDPTNPASFPLGVGLLSSLLKNNGHKITAIYVHEDLNQTDVLDNIFSRVKKSEPDLIAYSATTPSFHGIAKIAPYLRSEMSTLSICGGPHATIYPEETLAESGIDYVCVGEGEKPLVEFVNALEKGWDCSTIPGIWSLDKNRNIIKNKLYPLVQDLDSLPWIDYEVFGKQFIRQLTADGWLWAISSRGCPYNCSYCHIPMFRKIYSEGIDLSMNKIGYVRFRGTDSLIEELLAVSERYNLKIINLADDLFSFKKSSVLEFARKFKERLPEHVGYSIQTHLNHLDEEIIAALYDSRCKRVIVGVESGSERILKLLNRKTSLKMMRETLSLLAQTGFPLGTCTTNMVGIPTETKQEMLDTIKLNAEVLVERVKINILAPYPKSKIFDFCLKNNLFIRSPDDLDFDDRRITKLKFPDQEMAFLNRLFDVGHWYMNLYAPLGLESYYQPLIDKIERISSDEWPEAREHYLKVDADLSDSLTDKSIPHYKFILKGKIHSKEIGLSSLRLE